SQRVADAPSVNDHLQGHFRRSVRERLLHYVCPLQATSGFPNTFPARGKGCLAQMRPGSTDCVCVLSRAPPPTSVGFLTAHGLCAAAIAACSTNRPKSGPSPKEFGRRKTR